MKSMLSNILTVNSIKKSMPSCLVFAVVQTMTFMIDTMVAGHYLGTDEVAGVAFGLPVIGLMISLAAMITQGTLVKLLDAMGRNDMEKYNRLYSLSLVFLFYVNIIFVLLCFCCTDFMLKLGGASGSDLAAMEAGRLYIRATCLEILFFSIGSLLQNVITTYGYQTERMIGSFLCVVTNIITSIVFVNILPPGMKIVGLGIGSVLGTVVQLVASYAEMKIKHINTIFKFYKFNRDNIVECLDMIRRGIAGGADLLLESISYALINALVLSMFANGTGLVAMVSILNSLRMVINCVGVAGFYAGEPLVGIYNGERDYGGIKKTFTTTLKISAIYTLIASVVWIAAAKPIMAYCGFADNPDAVNGLIFAAIGGIFAVIPQAFAAVYEATGRILPLVIILTVPDSVIYPVMSFILCKPLGINGLWIGMAFNIIPFLIIGYLIFSFRFKSARISLSQLLLLNEDKERSEKLNVSVPADAKDVTFVSEEMQSFLRKNSVNEKAAYIASLCTEEIAADYITYREENNKNKNRKSYMDIKVFRDADDLEIIIKNYDEPYNPLVYEYDEENFAKIGVFLVQKVSQKITYNYVYHMNVVTIMIDA